MQSDYAPAMPTRTERRKARTAGAILDAAERLFRERGYQASTIEAIAAEADVAIGSIYLHFKGKEDLYLALVERVLDANERYLADAYARHAEPLDQIVAAGEAYLRFHVDHPLAFRLIALRDVGQSTDERVEAARRRIAERLDAMVRDLAGAIERAIEAGEVREVHPFRAATFMWAAWNGVLALHVRGTLDDRELRAVIRTGREIVTAGLTPAG